MNDIEEAILNSLQTSPQDWKFKETENGSALCGQNLSKSVAVVLIKYPGTPAKAHINVVLTGSQEFADKWWEIAQVFHLDRVRHAARAREQAELSKLRSAFGIEEGAA